MAGGTKVAVVVSAMLAANSGPLAAQSGPVEQVDVTSAEGPADSFVDFQPDVSADGRYVVFQSAATNLAPGVAPTTYLDVFVRDRVAGTTEHLAADLDGGSWDALTSDMAISDDGRLVAVATHASTLVPG